jgi:heavy metal translocating P-type ATPase
MMMKNEPDIGLCKHCGQASDEEFCCHGCEGAWHLIHKMGLDDYYSRRKGISTAKIGESIFITEELYQEQVTEENGLNRAVFYVTAVRCAACVWLVENVLSRMDGVEHVRVNYATYRTVISFDPAKISLKEILSRAAELGYPPAPLNPAHSDKDKKELFLRFAIGAFFTLQLNLYTVAIYAGYFQDMDASIKHMMEMISWAICTPVVIFTGWPFFKSFLNAIRTRHLSMDVLVALGAGSAYIYSIVALLTGQEVYFDTTATILTLITLGRYFELSAKHKAQADMLSLVSLTTPYARCIVDGAMTMIPVEKVQAGDVLELLPGDRVPVDGLVAEGFAGIDESMLTGEPLPVGKKPGDTLFAGTVNTNGHLRFAASKVGKDTMLAQITSAIEAADISRTRLIAVVDKIASVFVPVVLLIALTTFIVRFFTGSPMESTLMCAVAVMVVACPCAMGLAVPLAVNTAVGRAAVLGALVKNGDIFEIMRKTTVLCFDKTGTLTKGSPIVESYHTDLEPKHFLNLAASAESRSKHPLAKAISSFCGDFEAYDGDFAETAGQGVSLTSGDFSVAVGRYAYIEPFLKEKGEAMRDKMLAAAALGRSTAAVAVDGVFAGFFVLSDPLRDDSIAVIKRLQNKYSIRLLSGDNRPMLESISAELGGLEFQAELSPFDKAEYIKQAQERGECVVMAGDGLNDAPSLKQANAGIAVGQQASGLSMESADAILTRQDLGVLEQLFKLSDKTGKIVRGNLAWAFAYNIIAIPLAAAGLIHPVASAIFMSVSSVIVVLNSLRLKRV